MFVAMVSSGAKSNGACRRRSTSSTGEDVDVEADASANATVAGRAGEEWDGTVAMVDVLFGSTYQVDVVGLV